MIDGLAVRSDQADAPGADAKFLQARSAASAKTWPRRKLNWLISR